MPLKGCAAHIKQNQYSKNMTARHFIVCQKHIEDITEINFSTLGKLADSSFRAYLQKPKSLISQNIYDKSNSLF